MLKAYKTEINPTHEQIAKINRTIGVCRYLYNLYLATNQERHKKGQKFMSANEFDKWVNHEHSLEHPWIKEVSSKARKKAIVNAETAYKRFFKGLAKFPRFKKKRNQDVKLYFPKNNSGDWTIERHRIQIPTIKQTRIKEYGYLPVGSKVISGTVSKKADRYFVSVVVDTEPTKNNDPYSEGIGVDVGIKDFAVVSNETKIKNINKTAKVRKLEKRLKREQRRLSRKLEAKKKSKKRKEETATAPKGANLDKQIAKVQRFHHRLSNIRMNHMNQAVNTLVKTKPAYITIEDLNVSGMMKNRHLSKVVAQQKFHDFRVKLERKAQQNDIEVRIVSRFYPSSKMCNACGHVKKHLKLSERTYTCECCGYIADRDLNAALNLKDAKEYKIAN